LKLHDLSSKPDLLVRKLRGLARVYRKTRMRQKEANVLEEILRRFPEGASAAKALNRLAQIYWNKGEDLKALATFERLKKLYPESPRVDFAELASARIFESLDKPDEAIRIYRNFSKKFPNSPLRHQAAWRLAWRHYLQGDYHHAQAGFKRLAVGNGPERYTIRALFWQARTAERLGNPAEAKRLYGQILKGKDANYYVGLAAKGLKRTGGTIRKNETSEEPPPTEVAPSLSPNHSFHFSRARELASLSLHRLAVAELDRMKDQTPSASPLRLTLMRIYARNRAFDRSIVLASRLNHPTRNLKRYLFPLAYWETIKESAHKRGLDPFLILALIRQESLFDPEALSPASAFGLMQLLVSTAGREARQMGLTAPAPEKLFNPDLNIKLGSRHLKGLLQIYSNSLVKALAAYNAGKNAVDRWEREIPVKDEEEFVERIPYRETRNYVKLVLRNYLVYKNLYDRGP
ncbi:MAG: transglycosylase SLT domain-containing protein, partial [Candidatus Binatia bacterium]|nr:transglycosylase SLT domain-containing protein [Candidatus Binatia bacterium]